LKRWCRNILLIGLLCSCSPLRGFVAASFARARSLSL
jgi:hypothetical protein